jgi:hypothetical protein
VKQVRELVAEERGAGGGHARGAEWVLEKLKLLSSHTPTVEPSLPTVTRPPIQPAPGKFKGVLPPEVSAPQQTYAGVC